MKYRRYDILQIHNHILKDPTFQMALGLVAEWANMEGKMNRTCNNFVIEHDDSEEDLVQILCDIDYEDEDEDTIKVEEWTTSPLM